MAVCPPTTNGCMSRKSRHSRHSKPRPASQQSAEHHLKLLFFLCFISHDTFYTSFPIRTGRGHSFQLPILPMAHSGDVLCRFPAECQHPTFLPPCEELPRQRLASSPSSGPFLGWGGGALLSTDIYHLRSDGVL